MTETKASVNFSCQRCLQPLRLDESLGRLGEHALAELSLPVTRHSESDRDRDRDREARSGPLDHYVAPYRLAERDIHSDTATMSAMSAPASGFMLVSSEGDADCLSRQLYLKAALFDTLSNNSDVDHPLCDECTDSLLQLMDHQLKLAEGEWKDYSDYLKKIENEKDDLNLEALQKELLDWKEEEKRLLEELDALQKQEKELKDEIVVQESEKERLVKEQNIYLREYTRYRKDLMNSEDQAKYFESQLAYTQLQLEKLNKINVFKAAFYISHSGHFGIINNFRLGRLQDAPVDWSEINAAWGQTALLLSSLARKINFTFQKYKLIPFGNHSYIECLDDHKELPLYGSGGFRLLWDTKFDAAMVAFLDCMQQFKEQVEKGDVEFCLPYKIIPDKGKIEDSAGNSFSIKIQFNSEEQWTKALKYMLTNLKWGLAWVSSQLTDDKLDC